LYDVDKDGVVSRGDVEALLRIVGGTFLDQEKIQEHAANALFGKDSVTFDEFCTVCCHFFSFPDSFWWPAATFHHLFLLMLSCSYVHQRR